MSERGPARRSPPAILSLIFGIVGLVSLIAATVAIVMGYAARYRARHLEPDERWQALGTWGLALGFIGLVGQITFWAFYFAGNARAVALFDWMMAFVS